MYELHTTRRVEFADTDMAGIVHFSRFFVYMETAEHDFLRTLGTPVHFDHDRHRIGWPRVETWCRYQRPARVHDELDIHVRVLRKGRRALTWGFTFRCQGEKLAEGRISSICCALDGPGGLEPVTIPPFLANQIEEAPDAARTLEAQGVAPRPTPVAPNAGGSS